MNWSDVIKYVNHGNLTSPRKVEKTDEEWREQLSEEQFRVARLKRNGTRF